MWHNPNVQEYGRIGQRQHGVDIHGRINNSANYGGVQCKDKDGLAAKRLTKKEMQQEVLEAKNFSPALLEFVIVYTGPRDEGLQDEANRLTEENRKAGLFSVSVWSWQEIKAELAKHLDLLRTHYPAQFGSTVAAEDISRVVVAEVSQEVKAVGARLSQELSSGIVEGIGRLREEGKPQAGAELEAELAHIKKLIETHKPKTCLEFIDDIIKKRWDTVTDKTRYKLLTNKGSCFLVQSKGKEAGALFVQALQYNQDDEKALVNAALGYSILDERESATTCLDRALAKNRLNADAWTLRLQYSTDLTELSRLKETVPKSLRDNASINWAYAVALQRDSSFLDAEESMALALQYDKERRIDLLVQLGALRLKNALDDAKLVGTGTLTTEVRNQIESSVSLLSEALSRLSESEIVPVRIQALIDRGIAYRILSQTENAKKDLDQAIEWSPQDFEATKQRAILAAEEERFHDAILLLRPFAGVENAFIAKMLLSETYRQAKDYSNAIKLLEGCENWPDGDGIRLNAMMIQADCYLKLLDKASALTVVDKMKQVAPMSFAPFVFHARMERLYGQKEAARQLAMTAKSLVADEMDFFEEWKLADELYALELFADAAQIYTRLAVPERNDGVTRRLIESHYEADQWDFALDYCRRLRKHHPDVQYATEIACGILEATGNLKAAIEILQEYLSLKPDDCHERLRLASAYRRDGKNADSDLELMKIEPTKLGPGDTLHYVSMLLNKGETENAIRIMYEARRKYNNDAEIDMGYISTILGRGEQIAIMEEPERVSVDSVVFLENDHNEKSVFIIENRPNGDLRKDEFNVENANSKKLMGMKVGDTIDLEENPIQKRVWTIKTLKSKYAYALAEALDTHSVRFPGRHDFFRIATPTDEMGQVDGEELRKQMLSTLPDERQHGTLEDFYKQGKLTIGALAQLAGRDLLATTVYLASTKEVGIYSSTGNQEEYEKGIAALVGNKGIVIDPVSIIVMEMLKAKEWISDKYGPLVLPQSTLMSST